MNKEQKVVLGIVIVSILLIGLIVGGVYKPFHKNEKILLNGFEISQSDLKAIQDLSEEKGWGRTSVCNTDVKRCSLLTVIP